jgi:hypothetical protein
MKYDPDRFRRLHLTCDLQRWMGCPTIFRIKDGRWVTYTCIIIVLIEPVDPFDPIGRVLNNPSAYQQPSGGVPSCRIHCEGLAHKPYQCSPLLVH